MTLYLDASVLVPLFIEEPDTQRCISIATSDDGRPVVSDYGAGEVGSVMSRLVRQNDLTADQALIFLAGFDRWSVTAATWVEALPTDVSRAAALVRRFSLKLRLPDALHLAICERLGTRIVTRDRRMGTAAEAIGLDVVGVF